MATTIPSLSMASTPLSNSLLLHHKRIAVLCFDFSRLSTKPNSSSTFLNLKSLKTQLSPSRQFRAVDNWENSPLPTTFDEEEGEEEGEEEEEEEEEDEEEEDEDPVPEESASSSSSPSAEGKRLYVGNLPYTMTSSKLTEIFGEAGRVSTVEVVYDRVTDRSRGFAFVTMGSVEDAKNAIRMFDGSQVGGRTVKVNFPEIPRGREREVMGPKIYSSYKSFIDSPHKIYAGNLAWSVTSEGLKDAFSDQPGVLSAKVIYEGGSRRSRGFGFISFSSAEKMQAALDAMNGVELEGRPLRLNLGVQGTSRVATTLQETKLEKEVDIDGYTLQE